VSRRVIAGAAATLLAAVLPYAGTLRNGFVWDDNLQLRFEPPRSLEVGRLLTEPSWRVLDAEREVDAQEIPTYRPLLIASFVLDAKLWRDRAAGWHATNLILFAAWCLCAYALALAATRRPALAAAFAAIYTTQGVLSESVAWVSGRHDVLMSLWLGLSMLAVVGAARSSGRRRAGLLILAPLVFALALFAKESVLLIPLALPVLLWAPPLRDLLSARARATLVLTYAAVAAGYLVFRFAVVAPHNLVGGSQGLRLVVQAAPMSALRYMGLFFFTPHLSSHYVRPPIEGFGWTFLLPLGVHLLLLGAAWRYRRRWPAVAAGLALFYATLAPALVWVANKPEFSLRFLFLPSLGLLMAVFAVLDDLMRRSARLGRLVPALVVILAVAGGLRVHQRCGDYRDDGTFYASLIRDVPQSAIGYVGLGDWAQRTGRLEIARWSYEKAIDVDPGYPKSHNNLGVLLLAEGRRAEAEAVLRRALQLFPDYANLHFNLGLAMEARHRKDEAERCYRKALRLRPGYANALERLRVLEDEAR
jgi:protein O-mannosyl-transferase